MKFFLFVFLVAFGALVAWSNPNDVGTMAGNSKSDLKMESFEVNLLWPFYPGGISEFRYLIPIGKSSSFQDGRVGKLVLGLYSDYASKVVRTDEYGKVSLLAFKFGYRYYFMSGWQVEISNNLGWRQERNRPGVDKENIEGISSRLWTMFGYEHSLSPLFYLNYRLGVGVHLYRSDEYSHLEKKNVAGGDVNLGIRF